MPDQNNAVETCLRNLKNAFGLQPAQMPEARRIVLQFFDDILSARYATDEEFEASAKRMMAKHAKSLARLADA